MQVYEATYADLVRFVQRRAHPDHAEDVVAESFLVAWRRLGELPAAQDDARAWVFGIARHVMLNQRRGQQRQRALGVRLADAHPEAYDAPETDLVVSRIDLSRAWEHLSEVHQEVLALSALDGLAAPQAAVVLGISPVAFRLRLSRARRALRLHLDRLPTPANPTAAVTGRTSRP